MANYLNSDAFVDFLNAQGVGKVFINPGFEHNPIQISIASARTEAKKAPQLVLCLDEAVTISAAYGNYMVTGTPQVALVHSELGTLQLGGNLQNLQWGRVPIVILAAYQEIDIKRTLWNGKPYDQGSIVRNSVKYDRSLNGDEDFNEVLAEAFRIACTEPMGPVYLSFPMNYLAQEAEKIDITMDTCPSESLPKVDMNALSEMADILLAADKPMLVSGNAGRHFENVASLTKLAELLGAQVLTGYSWMNFPTNHPLCIGIEQIGGSRKMDAGYDDADVIIAIDYAMPYVRSASDISDDTKILHIDVDPLTQGRLLWGRGADMFIKADSREAIPALIGLIESKMTPDIKSKIEERSARLMEVNRKNQEKWHSDAANQADCLPVSPDYFFNCLNELIDDETIVVHHTLGECASATEQIVRTKPGTWFGCPSGAIGWALGAGLGASSGSPGKTVVSIMTDGGFVWGCPTSALWTSAAYKFPFLAIICNNGGYSEIRKSQKRILGNEDLTNDFFVEAAAEFQPDYSMIAQGAGAYGRMISKPDEVIPAIKEALAVVRGGRPAVLDVRLPRDNKI